MYLQGNKKIIEAIKLATYVFCITKHGKKNSNKYESGNIFFPSYHVIKA